LLVSDINILQRSVATREGSGGTDSLLSLQVK